MRHDCHDPFCTKRMVTNNHRKHRPTRGPPRARKSPQCTAAVQEFNHTVGGLHAWKRCRWPVGQQGDKATMRCALHKAGTPGAKHPTWGQQEAGDA